MTERLMQRHYRLYTKPNDPVVKINLPQNLLQDLQRCAIENGRDLNTEFLIRLSRSLKIREDSREESEFLSYLFSGDHDDELFFPAE